MNLQQIEITPSELNALTVWILDSFRITYPKFTLEMGDKLFPEMRKRIQLWPNFRVVAWKKEC
jgi:hypothetical protein